MIKELNELLTFDAGMQPADIDRRFVQIASLLFGRCAVKKGDKTYLFKDIEFYFYNRNHPDIVTHPRSSDAMQWYINNFGGVDINLLSRMDYKDQQIGRERFARRYILDDDAFFGGVLLRQLVSLDGKEILDGPWACGEIFRSHSAVGHEEDYPIIIEHPNGMVGYIRKARQNILRTSQTVEKRVDSIAYQYCQHPDHDQLYADFQAYKDKPYRFIRCGQLMHDSQSEKVYFSALLKKDHPDFYRKLCQSLQSCDIDVRELRNTKDYWARDYMPVQLAKGEYLKYVYSPDYLVKSKNRDDANTITDCTKPLLGLGISCRSTKLIIDGGNMVACGPYVVMTDKVFTENGRVKGDEAFLSELESELGHPVIIIPWTMHGDFDAEDTDKYGHADGFVKWCGGNRILMGNHGDEYPEEAAAIRRALEAKGFEVTEMRFADKVPAPRTDLSWAYINFLQVGHHIFMPTFGIAEDTVAEGYIREAFPDCTIHGIESTEIAREGGALHCIAWNV